jgi:hypothetical protein
MDREQPGVTTDDTDGRHEKEVLPPGVAIERVRTAVASWDGVTIGEHRYGGIEFRFDRRELGHLHGIIADLPFPRDVRDDLVAAGRARPHPLFAESGWVTILMRTDVQVANVIELLRRNYDRPM